MVLTTLYPPLGVGAASAPTVDIVIIHGLNGDAIESWTNANTKAFWPKDCLPFDLPEARVFTFGYNADAAFGNTTADIVDHAKDLLGSLIDKREEEEKDKVDHIHRSFAWWYCSKAGSVLSAYRISILVNLRTYRGNHFLWDATSWK